MPIWTTHRHPGSIDGDPDDMDRSLSQLESDMLHGNPAAKTPSEVYPTDKKAKETKTSVCKVDQWSFPYNVSAVIPTITIQRFQH